jgi:hypothetical protein
VVWWWGGVSVWWCCEGCGVYATGAPTCEDRARNSGIPLCARNVYLRCIGACCTFESLCSLVCMRAKRMCALVRALVRVCVCTRVRMCVHARARAGGRVCAILKG